MRPFARILKYALAVGGAMLAASAAGTTLACDGKKAAPPPAAQAPAAAAAAAPERAPDGTRIVRLQVTKNGYEPSPVTVKKGEPLKLVVTRTTDETCATEIIFDDPPVKADLPLNTPVELTLTPQKEGKLVYGCHMEKMVSGALLVE